MKRERFNFKENTIYPCGHSLGPLSEQARKSVEQCLEEWGQEGVMAWNKHNWIHLPYKLGALIAPLIGDPGIALSKIINELNEKGI